MGGLLGGAKGMLAPLSNYLGACPPPPFLRLWNVMDWSSLSVDLAPSEHLWDELDGRVYIRDPQQLADNFQELERALFHEWQRIPQNVITRLIHSMRRRCNACIQPRGAHTRY